MRLQGLLAACLGLLLQAQDLPLLRMETGMHTALIRRMAVDARGRYLVTASDDKTLRVWDPLSGAQLAVLRPPIGPGNEGRIFACALDPAGEVVAAGGWMSSGDEGESVYLFERATGRLLRRIGGLPETVLFLAFSRDGRRLAACLDGRGGVRIFKTSDGEELAKDEDYGDRTRHADFDGEGRLVTSSHDRHLRLYDDEGRLLLKLPVGDLPGGVKFAPGASVLAVGYSESSRVELRSAGDLSLLALPEAPKGKGDLSELAWSPDGRTLYGAGTHQSGGRYALRAWSNGGRGSAKDHPVASNTLMDVAVLPDGRVAWASADPAWGLLGSSPRLGAIADLRANREGFGLDRGGTRVGFGFEYGGKRPAFFDAAARELGTGLGRGLAGPRTSTPGFTLTGWNGTAQPRLNGRPLMLAPEETSLSAALDPPRGMLLGTIWHLYAFDLQGVLRWRIPAPSFAWSVNVAPEGALGVAAFGDGTLRWYRMEDGKELLAFFPHRDGRRWVAWTPGGYFDCSPGGEDLVGWHVNRGKEEAADFFAASRFRSRFYRPDVVGLALQTREEEGALRLANDAAGRRADEQRLQTLMPPVVRLLSPEHGSRIPGASVSVRVSVRHPSGAAIDQVWAAVDGRRVDGRGLRPMQEGGQDRIYTLDVPFPGKDCTVSVFAQSGSAVSEAASVALKGAPPAPAPVPTGGPTPPPAFVIQPKLYILAVGVGTYQRKDLSLDFPAKDARDLAEAFKLQKGRLYREVETRLLADGDATRDNILDGLEWLERQVTAKDVAVVFLAGHGINDPAGQYYFLPSGADPDRIKRTMVADSDVRTTLAKLPGKVLLFLDTCHSGNILGGVRQRGGTDLNGFINELSSAENGVVVFSASTGKQASQESPDWNNGAFTKALVEGLRGKADYQRTGRITLNMLDLYISERVKELTKGTQSPTTAKPSNVPDFPVALSR